MTSRKLLLTLLHPLPAHITLSKDSAAKRLKKSAGVFESGVMFKGAENSGGNALGALYPLLHLTSEIGETKKLAKTVSTSSGALAISQAVYKELDAVDVAGEHVRYDTNSVILVGCKILEVGSRVANGLEQSWRSWTNIGVLVAHLQTAEIKVQNLQFIKQVAPSDTHIFMYCILVNMRLSGEEEETRVLAGLQRMRGSVVAGYTALYTVMGSLNRSSSEDSMERLIMNVSRGEERKRRHSQRRSVNSV